MKSSCVADVPGLQSLKNGVLNDWLLFVWLFFFSFLFCDEICKVLDVYLLSSEWVGFPPLSLATIVKGSVDSKDCVRFLGDGKLLRDEKVAVLINGTVIFISEKQCHSPYLVYL